MLKTDKQFFPALTGYRAIAAWMIFVYHFMPFNSNKYPLFAKQVVSHFHLGVDMFFVLSGFLITYRYFNDYPIHFKKYMVNRFARIYPMYFLITAAVFIVWILQNNTWNIEKTVEVVLSFTMTKALFTKYILVGIPQGWTLTLEEMFYFTAPFYFILIRKNLKWIFALPFIIFLFGVALKYISGVPQNTSGFLQNNIYVYIFEFFSGIGLGYILLNFKTLKPGSKIFTYGGLFLILVYLFGKSYVEHLINFKSDLGRAAEIIFISFLGIAPLVWGLITEKTLIQKILSTPAMVLLGKSSYIFYLIHKGFIPVFINDHITDNKLLIFIILNLLSISMFRFLEEPLNHFIRKKFAK